MSNLFDGVVFSNSDINYVFQSGPKTFEKSNIDWNLKPLWTMLNKKGGSASIVT